MYSKEKLRMFAIDEAHGVRQWGHDFRGAYLNLHVLRKNSKNVPIPLLTASATKQTRDDCMSVFGLNNPKIILSTVVDPTSWAYGKEKIRGAERNLPDFFGLCPSCQKKFSGETLQNCCRRGGGEE